MHAYIQWPGNQPLEQQPSEFDARDAILKKYPSAEFGPPQKLNGMAPGFKPTSFDHGVVVFPDKISKNPVAVVWFPVP